MGLLLLNHCAREQGKGVGVGIMLVCPLLSPELLVPPSYKGDCTGILYWLLTTLVVAVPLL